TDEAVRHADEILRLSRERKCDLVPCYSILGQVAEYRSDVERAETFYLFAAQEIERQGSSLPGDDLRVTFFKGKHEIYEALVRLALRHKDSAESIDEAYWWCERS